MHISVRVRSDAPSVSSGRIWASFLSLTVLVWWHTWSAPRIAARTHPVQRNVRRLTCTAGGTLLTKSEMTLTSASASASAISTTMPTTMGHPLPRRRPFFLCSRHSRTLKKRQSQLDDLVDEEKKILERQAVSRPSDVHLHRARRNSYLFSLRPVQFVVFSPKSRCSPSS